ncbi:hypothetical protein ACFE04_021988 [Oxalis oulophora]
MANMIITTKQCFVPKSKEDEEEIARSFEEYSVFISSLPKEKTLVNDEMVICEYKGTWFFSNGFGLEGLLWMQDHFNPKPTDIFLMTYPKCGTTWLKALVYSIVKRTQFDFSTHPLLTYNPHELVPFLEVDLFGRLPIGDPDIMPSPRILASHLPYNLLPKLILDSGCKMVSMSRDPKDTVVSKWHFLNKIKCDVYGQTQVPIEEAFDSFCTGMCPPGSYWDFVLGYWRASLECPENLLFLKYEAMKEDALGQVKKLAEFLGYPFTKEEEENEVIQEIVKLCSFESLSNLQVNKTGLNLLNLENKSYFRKGEIGDSKNHLMPDMMELIDKVTKEKLSDTGFTFHV